MPALLKKSAQRALTRLGDIIAPENGEFPSWSRLGCMEIVDDVLRNVPDSDRADLNTLLGILSLCPDFTLRWLVKKMGNAHHGSGASSVWLRQIDFAVRGLILSTYYSGFSGKGYIGKTPLEIIDYAVCRIED